MARILVVEDDASVQEFTRRALAEDGHEVDVAGDGEEGLEKLRANGRCELVLSDIRMPVMDGIEMARQIVEISPGIPILLMTGYAEQRERVAELEGDIRGVIDKPFTLRQLRDWVRRELG